MIKILNAAQNKEADTYTIQNRPILGINLMENAAQTCTTWIMNKFSIHKKFCIIAGPGNNGGDVLAIARLLSQNKYLCEVFIWGKKFSGDNQVNQKRLHELNISTKEIAETTDLPEINKNNIIIEGIFGSGLKRTVSGFASEIIRHINNSGATILSIDIPSGLFSEDNSLLYEDSRPLNQKIIFANYTLSIEMPFLSMLLPDNQDFVGEWIALSIGIDRRFINAQNSYYQLIEPNDISERLIKRKKFSHKGTFGHALLVVGSYGKYGAAVLAAKAALKSGLGLLTVHVPASAVNILQTAVPECMLSIDSHENILTKAPEISAYSALGVGCGLGKNEKSVQALKKLLQKQPQKLVLDADALNILSENKYLWTFVLQNTIITPHPKEFERLFGKTSNSYERLLLQQKSAKEYNIIIVLKGAHTSIAFQNGQLFFNITGNNGMATAGSGDVLTGFITGLLASGYSALEAAIIGVYLHGLAGDCAIESQSPETLIASDIIAHFSAAFKKVATYPSDCLKQLTDRAGEEK